MSAVRAEPPPGAGCGGLLLPRALHRGGWAEDSAGGHEQPRGRDGGRAPPPPPPPPPPLCARPPPARLPPPVGAEAAARNMTSIHFVVHPLPGTEDQLNDR